MPGSTAAGLLRCSFTVYELVRVTSISAVHINVSGKPQEPEAPQRGSSALLLPREFLHQTVSAG